MRSFAAACGLAFAATISGQAAAADNEIRLAGCLVRGQDNAGYLVTNVPGEAAWQRSTDATVVPGPVGTSGTVASIFYWLNDGDGLEEHVGHHVEIEGTLQGDLTDGTITVDRKDNWTEVEIRAGGESLKARVPRPLLVVPPSNDRRLDVLVRRVEAERIRMLAAVCGR